MKVTVSIVLLFFFGLLSAQNSEDTNSFEVNFLAGNAMKHGPDIDRKSVV